MMARATHTSSLQIMPVSSLSFDGGRARDKELVESEGKEEERARGVGEMVERVESMGEGEEELEPFRDSEKDEWIRTRHDMTMAYGRVMLEATE